MAPDNINLQRYQDLEKQLNRMETNLTSKLSDLDDKIDKIYKVIYEGNGEKSLVEKVNSNEYKLTDLMIRFNRLKRSFYKYNNSFIIVSAFIFGFMGLSICHIITGKNMLELIKDLIM